MVCNSMFNSRGPKPSKIAYKSRFENHPKFQDSGEDFKTRLSCNICVSQNFLKISNFDYLSLTLNCMCMLMFLFDSVVRTTEEQL